MFFSCSSQILMSGYDDCQFAYRKRSSTVCALLAIQEHILRFLDDPKIGAVRIVTFDMSRAFDEVPHGILLDRFHSLHPSQDNFLSRWATSYLCSR